MLPTPRILAIVIASFAFAAPASAADPLLSGYSGPGGGDQAILGTEVLPAPGGLKGGSPQAPVRAVEIEPEKAPIAAITAAPSLTPQPAKRRAPSRSSEGGAPGRRTERGPVARAGGERAADPALLAAVTYPATSSDAEIVSSSTVLGMLLAVAALFGVGLWTARLAGRPATSRPVRS